MATPTATDQPGARQWAPGSLRLVQRFVNTVDIEDRQEGLDTPASLRRWLWEHDLIGNDEAVTDADLVQTLEIREALRDLLVANNGGPSPDARVLAALDRASERARLTVRFEATGSRLVPTASGVDGAIGTILAQVHAAMADGEWRRMKACRNHGCRWVFYDHSKNASSTWCTMRICGSREKSRRYRARRKTSPE